MSRKTSQRAQELELLQVLHRRQLQLWGVTTIVMISLGCGLIAVSWHPSAHDDAGTSVSIPALAGLAVLIVLLSAYLLKQKNATAEAERGLFETAIAQPGGAQAEMLDPETHVFSHAFLKYALPEEATRAMLEGTPTTALLIHTLKLVPNQPQALRGHADEFIHHAAYLLRRTFRGSDTIIRDSESTFLVLLPSTSLDKARFALNRMIAFVDKWNLSSNANYEIVLSWQIAECAAGSDLAATIEQLRSGSLRQTNPAQTFLEKCFSLDSRSGTIDTHSSVVG